MQVSLAAWLTVALGALAHSWNGSSWAASRLVRLLHGLVQLHLAAPWLPD